MLKIWVFVLTVILSGSAYSYERLSFYTLITDPQSYEGADIYLAGYFVQDGSDCLVVSNDKETALIYREYEMVKLCSKNAAANVKLGLFDKLVNRYGAVAGKFSIEECGDSINVGNSLSYLGCIISIDSMHGPVYENGSKMPPPPETR